MAGVGVRPMTADDVDGAIGAWTTANNQHRLASGLPPHPADDDYLHRMRRRVAYLLGTDPGGSWVATEDGGSGAGGPVVGLAQSFARDGYWVLSLLGVVAEAQRSGVGHRLLEASLGHGAGLRGTIQASSHPSAARLYQAAGFALHPTVAALGTVGPGTVSPHPGVRQGTEADLAVAEAVDRQVRGSVRTADLAHLLGTPGNRLLVAGEEAYGVVADDRTVTVAGTVPAAAAAVLQTALAQSPPGTEFEVMWLTSYQQWAIEVVVRAGLTLRPYGPVMARGMDGLPSPYIPSGGFG